MAHQQVIKAKPEILKMNVRGARNKPQRLLEMRQCSFRLTGKEEGNAQLKYRAGIIAVERDCLFQLGSRLWQPIFGPMRYTQSEIRWRAIRVTFYRLQCQFLRTS